MALLWHFLVSGGGRSGGFCCLLLLVSHAALWTNESMKMLDPSCESGAQRNGSVGTGFTCGTGGCERFQLQKSFSSQFLL